MDAVQRLFILPHEPIATISPWLYGQFTEHLGELIYPGIWVGENSSIPNTRGIRNDVVDALKPLGIPLLRWPGGCFADLYHWRDGIGPREQRPMRLNNWWGFASEPNQFGTHEFMDFCRMIGTEPYFTANVGSGTPQECTNWMEYCNSPSNSQLANERRANGSADPFGVHVWAIGNENWGCGGHMDAVTYASEYRRFRALAGSYDGAPLYSIACGACDRNWDWTRIFLQNMVSSKQLLADARGLANALAIHYYCGTAGTATVYDNKQWLELLSKAYAVEGLIQGHRAIMDEYDPDHKIDLILDEWGTWHPVEEGKPHSGLFQQNTMRDALVAAIHLDVFQNNAHIIKGAALAQTINVLQALLLVHEDMCVKTPTYHIWDLYKPHKGATAVRVVNGSETASYGEEASQFCQSNYLMKQTFRLPAVVSSASIKDGVLTITASNCSPDQTITLAPDLVGAQYVGDARIVRLSNTDITAHNTFDQPDIVQLSAEEQIPIIDGQLRVDMAPGSVCRIQATIK